MKKNKHLKITFLGTGTSHGVPLITCKCKVCLSKNRKNKRLRTSILIEDNSNKKNNLLIDCSKDFREQALKYKIDYVEHVLITHLHADHIFGIDELRIYNQVNKNNIKLYLNKKFSKEIKKIFPYIYKTPLQLGGGVTKVENNIVKPTKTFQINNFKITPILLYHGKLPILGYRINNIAYLTDCSFIPQESYQHLKNLDVLVLDALRETPHSTHFSLGQATNEALKINAKQTYFVHMAHNLEHEKTNKKLPANIELAYDGLEVRIPFN